MLAASIKADLVRDTVAACSRHGEAEVFDPTNSSGLPTAVWSPIAASTSWTAARRTAAGILADPREGCLRRVGCFGHGEPLRSDAAAWPAEVVSRL